ncbi:putative serine/threonine-protein kinase [Phytophthora ramorum]|uniref:putative serine/threonine-protein kinase n=1 Tax=Phytophthora ramorum TaxID=164328 RepID=UPI0030AAB559|nr:putative serine/threonine-protein kinase [Phytophthora ramorum]
MGVLQDLVIPGSGTVAQTLSTILQLSADMKEGKDACKRLHQRLKCIFDELKKREKKKRAPSSGALDKYAAVVLKTLRYLEHYQGKKLVFRLMKQHAVLGELRLIHEDIDMLCRDLHFSSAKVKWKHDWESDGRIHQELLAASVDDAQAVLAELSDARSQMETMLALKFEDERRPEHKDPATTKLLRIMMGTVIRASMTTVPKLPPWFLPPYDIHFTLEPFARGSFATVHRGVQGSGTNVVVKCFLVDGVDVDDRTRQGIEAEMNLWHQFSHPNVIKLLGASHISTPPFVVCEEAINGDLRSFLTRSDSNKRQMWTLLYQAALGLNYIHKKRVVHGDLKLNNILVGADGQAKLSDFGLSTVRTSAILSETVGEMPYTFGALRWRAPECLKKAPTFASDVYSFAMCIIEAVTGEPPFSFVDDDSVHEKLRNGNIPEKPDSIPIEAWELVVAMTNAVPEQRVELPHILSKLKSLADNHAENIIVNLLDRVSAVNDSEKEQSMLQLVRMCAKDEERPVLYEANAIPILTNLVKSGRTNYVKLYALQCLKWAAGVDSKLSQPEFDALRDCVQEAPVKVLASVANALKYVLQSLVALWQSVSESQKLWVGMVQTLVSLMQSGNDTQKLWAAEAVGSLTMENEAIRAEIMRVDAITPLVALLRAGTNELKHRATYALKRLAFQKEASSAIVQKGAIEPLIVLARVGTTQQKQTTTALLESLVLPCYSRREDIEHEASIASLLALVLVGTDEQKETAASVLVKLSMNDESRIELARTGGGICPLVELASTGNEQQKCNAVGVLANLAFDSIIATEIQRNRGIAPLVEAIRTGTEQQKSFAVGALQNLACNDGIRTDIAREGGVKPLIELAQSGTDQQKESATRVLMTLAPNDAVRSDILSQGGVSSLLGLLRTGTDQQKETVAGLLGSLATSEEGRVEIAREGGIGPLVGLLRTGSQQQKTYAAEAIENLAKSSDKIRAELVREGSIPLLKSLSRSESKQHKESAARALQQLNGGCCAVM